MMESSLEQKRAEVNWRRNAGICKKFAEGWNKAALARDQKLSKEHIKTIIKRYGGDDKVRADFATPINEKGEKLVPLIDETDLLRSGMAAANDKLSKTFIKLALELNEDEMGSWKSGTKLKFLSILAPLVKSQVKAIAPTQVNFFVNKNVNTEDLERKLLDYASGNAKKVEEEK